MPKRRGSTGNGKFKQLIRQFLAWTRRNIPPGLRLVLGLVLIIGGIFGFLPILGFWMIPLGIAIAALDIRPIWRKLSSK